MYCRRTGQRSRAARVFVPLGLALVLTAAACGGGGGGTEASKRVRNAPAGETPVAGDPAATDALAAPGDGGTSATSATGRKRSSAKVGSSARGPSGGTVPVADLGPRPASEDRTGVTKDKIRLGYHWPKTSYYGAILKSYIEHFQLYITGKGGLNERGGVGGRKIELVEADDQMTPSGAAAAAKQLEDTFTVYGHAGVEQQVVVLSSYEQKKIPYVANGLMSTHVKDSKYGFTFLTPWDIVAQALPSYINNFMKLKGKPIGVIWESPDWPVPKDAFLAEAAAAGLDVRITEQVTATQASYVANLDKVRGKGVEVVVLISRLSAPGILRDARAMGWSPTWTGFGPWTLNLFNTASGNLMEGIKAVRQWQGVDSAKYAEYVAFMKANGKENEASEEGYGGWMIGYFYENVLARAGKDPTRQSLIEGLEKTGAAPIELAITPPVQYSAGRHWQSDQALPVQVKNGNWVKIGSFANRF